jgi:cytochrome c551/c552
VNKLEILTAALEHRAAEVFQHQINIDNYRLALEEIAVNYADDADIAPFADRLRDLLSSSVIEQRKEIIMRDVIARQVEALCFTS